MNGSIQLALVCALSALVGCASPRRAATPAGDTELSRLNNTARAAFDRGSPTLAGKLYEQALTRARALDDATSIGNAAYNAAACRIALGEHEPARELLREAETELARAKANLADVFLLQAKLAHWQARRDDALRFATQLLSDPGSTPSPVHRAEAALLKGQLACDDRDVARARSALDEAMQQTKAAKDNALRAGCEKLSGAIFLLEKQPAAAAEAFDREAALCQQARQPRSMVLALCRAGDAWRDAGQTATAAERFFRAARSSFAQGYQSEAVKSVELSLSLATQAQDDGLTQRARQLQAEIRKSSPLPP